MKQQVAINDIYIPLLSVSSRYLILYGGAGSGKSVFAGQKVITRIISEEKHRILCIRKVANTLRESVFKLLKETIHQFAIADEFEINKTDKTFRHVPTGNEIICVGLDDAEKLKSVYDITSIWIEEGTELVAEDFDQVDLRLRGETANYKQIMITFNPIDERHWLNKRFFQDNTPNTEILRTTYLDNYFIDDDYKGVLESKAQSSPNFYRIYKLGEWGKPEVQRPYVHNFNVSQHVSDKAVFNPALPVHISLDFNVEPFVCLMNHTWVDGNGPHKHWFREIIINNGDFNEMAERIKSTLPASVLASALFTGDATGNNRRLDVRPGVSAWKILSELLNISPNRLKVRSSNPSVSDTRPLINLIFSAHPDMIFNPSMSLTINELMYTEADEEGNIMKKDRNKLEQRSDTTDAVRYDLLTFHSGFEKELPYLRSIAKAKEIR